MTDVIINLSAFGRAEAVCDTPNRVPQEVWDAMEEAIIANEARGPRWQAKYAFSAMAKVFTDINVREERVGECRDALRTLMLLQYEDRYAEVYGVSWDDCMDDSIANKGMDATSMQRMIVGRFLKLAREDAAQSEDES